MNEHDFALAEDGFVQVTPVGEYAHEGAGLVQVIDRLACDMMAAAFAVSKAAGGENFPGLLVDFDHFSLDTGKPSEAAGWVGELEARDDGLWARVRWSDSGLAAVTGGRYRLLSPVFRHPAGTQDLGGGRVRPVWLESVALTNEPNIRGGKPIANRRAEDGGQRSEDGGRKTEARELKTKDGGDGGTRRWEAELRRMAVADFACGNALPDAGLAGEARRLAGIDMARARERARKNVG